MALSSDYSMRDVDIDMRAETRCRRNLKSGRNKRRSFIDPNCPRLALFTGLIVGSLSMAGADWERSLPEGPD